MKHLIVKYAVFLLRLLVVFPMLSVTTTFLSYPDNLVFYFGVVCAVAMAVYIAFTIADLIQSIRKDLNPSSDHETP